MRTIYAFDIEYDTDEVPMSSLPQKLSFRVEDDFDAENELVDLISEETGQLVMGSSFSWTH